MIFRGLRLPPGAEVLCADGRGGTGNVTLVFRGEHPPRVLKIYRTRRSAVHEALGGLAHRFLEGKRGASPAARCETERLAIACWEREGFPVVPRLDLPPPPDLGAPCNWLAYVDAPTLQQVLRRPPPGADPAALVTQLGADCARRHRRALEKNEPLLVHERGLAGHVFVTAGALVWFDLENGFQPGYPLRRALARELAGLARSLRRDAPGQAADLLAALARGYGDRALLQELAQATDHGLPTSRRRERVDLLRQLLASCPP